VSTHERERPCFLGPVYTIILFFVVVENTKFIIVLAIGQSTNCTTQKSIVYLYTKCSYLSESGSGPRR
jgi:hypothetical protein